MTFEITERTEDYLRSIYGITKIKGFARIKDVALDLDVKPSSVVEMAKKLHDKGFISYERYGGITITTRGRGLAEVIEKRHKTFRKFLEIILVPKEIALKDAHIL